MVYILFLLGFVLLFLGGKYLVEGSVSFAKSLNISPLVIGIVLVGFGTSAPEMLTCIKAVLSGSSDIAIGNVVGSNIANILLVLSVGSIMCTVPIKKKEFKRDMGVLICASILLTSLCFVGFVNLYMGIVFDLILLLYISYCYKHGGIEQEEVESVSKYVFVSLLVAFLGIAGVVIGADLLVESSIKIARSLNISESFIALSAIAIGTSLPELATVIAASLKKHTDVVLGGIIGSNIFNTLAILGTSAIVRKIDISKNVLYFDIWVMNLAVALVLFFALKKWKLNKLNGIILLVLYVVYMIIIALRG